MRLRAHIFNIDNKSTNSTSPSASLHCTCVRSSVSQYASHAFRDLLSENGFTGSMSRKGNCWDNAVAESFFGSLKEERVHYRHYQTRYEAQQDILNYITMFYNPERLHSYLDYQSPNQYEAEMREMKKVA